MLIKRGGQEHCFREEGTDESPRWPQMDTVYDADECVSRHNLRFVDLSKASNHGQFVLEHRSRPQYTSNEGTVCDTLYRAVITLMWPKQKRLDILSGNSHNLKRMLAKVSDGGSIAAIDYMPTWYDETSDDGLSFNQAKVVMGFSNAFSESQAPIALRFVLPYMNNEMVRKGAVALVLRFRWTGFDDQFTQSLSMLPFRSLKDLKGSLRTLRHLEKIVPYDIRVKALDLMLIFLHKKRKIFEKVPGVIETWTIGKMKRSY